MNDNNNPLIKVKFKGSRREYFRNSMEFPIKENDRMVVEVERGEDIGKVLAENPGKKPHSDDESIFPILRKATNNDLIRNSENRIKEKPSFKFCKRKIKELNLPMRLVDVEYRLDRKKITFYFTAEDRIDFRELVKILAAEYKTRIEMRQISTREELKRTGGIGHCGKPLCCTDWLDDFEPISTQLVKEQNLPMNPSKISGCCGKLKCCFRYEHDTYSEFLKNYPAYGSRVQHEDKTGTIEKIDIFQKTVTIKFDEDQLEEFHLQDFDNKIKVLK